MKIAVASGDGVSISLHFGRSRCFIVFDIAEGKIIGREVRDNTHTAHAKGQCANEDTHPRNEPHSHADIVNALADCQVVLCCGMGWRAAEDLTRSGIKPYVIERELSPEQAANAYLAGKLEPAGSFCRCDEHLHARDSDGPRTPSAPIA